jgi:hypothetical protein
MQGNAIAVESYWGCTSSQERVTPSKDCPKPKGKVCGTSCGTPSVWVGSHRWRVGARQERACPGGTLRREKASAACAG